MKFLEKIKDMKVNPNYNHLILDDYVANVIWL